VKNQYDLDMSNLGPKVKYKGSILKPSDMEYKYYLLTNIINASPYNGKKEAVELQSMATTRLSPSVLSPIHQSFPRTVRYQRQKKVN
jgi:hypothetical protein